MTKLFLIVALLATAFTQNSFAQNTNSETSSILTAYYSIKDALVAGNATLAATKATELTSELKEAKTISAEHKAALLKEASKISASKEIKTQRDAFSGLSEHLIAANKAGKLGAEPIYQQYCPMKKSNWLSKEKTVKNPYYGASMLTCGKVVATF